MREKVLTRSLLRDLGDAEQVAECGVSRRDREFVLVEYADSLITNHDHGRNFIDAINYSSDRIAFSDSAFMIPPKSSDGFCSPRTKIERINPDRIYIFLDCAGEASPEQTVSGYTHTFD